MGITFAVLALYRYGLLDRERRHLRHAFGRYLAPAMVERLVHQQKLPELGGEQREITHPLLRHARLHDAVGAAAAARLTQHVNEFLTLASDAVMAEGGTVDKYVGDAIMAFFNAPLDQRDHAVRACRAALSHRRRDGRAQRRARAPDSDAPRLRVGVGINTGACTVGNFGSPQRLDYSALGDPGQHGVAHRVDHQGFRRADPGRASAPLPRRLTIAWLPLSGRDACAGARKRWRSWHSRGTRRLAASEAFRAVAALHARWLAARAAGNDARERELASALRAQAPALVTPLYAAGGDGVVLTHDQGRCHAAILGDQDVERAARRARVHRLDAHARGGRAPASAADAGSAAARRCRE